MFLEWNKVQWGWRRKNNESYNWSSFFADKNGSKVEKLWSEELKFHILKCFFWEKKKFLSFTNNSWLIGSVGWPLSKTFKISFIIQYFVRHLSTLSHTMQYVSQLSIFVRKNNWDLSKIIWNVFFGSIRKQRKLQIVTVSNRIVVIDSWKSKRFYISIKLNFRGIGVCQTTISSFE